MSSFSERFQTMGEPLLFREHGEPVVYTGPDSVAIDATAIVSSERTRADYDGNGGEWLVHSRTVTVRKTEVADPKINSKITVGGLTYKIVDRDNSGGSTVRLRVERRSKTQITAAEHYQGNR